MAFEATFYHGDPRMVDYTPSGAVSAGQVVVQNDLVGIAHLDIEASRLGALAVGGGVYKVNGDAAIAVGKKVYWVDASNKVSESSNSGANKVFGITVSACAGDGLPCYVKHEPAQ